MSQQGPLEFSTKWISLAYCMFIAHMQQKKKEKKREGAPEMYFLGFTIPAKVNQIDEDL